MIKNKKILITGLNSSISKNFISFLDKTIFNSVIYILTNKKNKINKKNNLNKKNIKIIFLKKQYTDLYKYKKLLIIVIIFFILPIKIQNYLHRKNSLKDFKINVVGLKNILKETQNNKN